MINWFSDWMDFWFRNEVTRDRLGHLGGNPRFHPPHYSAANDIAHGIAPGGKYSRERDKREEDDGR